MKQYIVDTFTNELFKGNPAAICIIDSWISDHLMINITRENNLSETAFAVKEGNTYNLRWFTPGGEIDLCGHATLGCAYVIMNYIDTSIKTVTFNTISGYLTVTKHDTLYEMDFPAYKLENIPITEDIIDAIGETPIEAYLGRDLLCIFSDEKIISNIKPNIDKVKNLPGLLLHISAPGHLFDCVSRSFAPKLNVYEDPVCGSGHCHISPYWGRKLNKSRITAYQDSSRGGILYCKLNNNRVNISGEAITYSISDININL
ncbi:MAG: PhzF family phenazine biosynthesis protein [Clostridium sp.]